MSYECAGGSLKLKGVIDKKIKKKKKSKSKTSESLTTIKPSQNESFSGDDATASKSKTENSESQKKITKTKAELAFEKAIDRRMEENILKRAAKSHKERVEIYNNHLESLSEFHDIPKVSWTK